MVLDPGCDLQFTTTSNDFEAVLLGPNGAKPVHAHEALDTGTVGFYTLTVTDKQGRDVTVTLEGGKFCAVPKKQSAHGKPAAAIGYQVK